VSRRLLQYLLVGVLALGAVVAGATWASSPTKAAANWSTTGTTFTASASGGSLLTITRPDGTLVKITCTSASLTGGSVMGTPGVYGGPPTTTTWAGVFATTPTFSGCTAAFSTPTGPVTGSPVASFTCNGGVVPAQFDAKTYNPAGTGTTTGSLGAVGCTYTYATTCPVVVTGAAPATYANSGTLTALASGQTLHASWNNVNYVCRLMFGATNNAASNTGPATLTATGGGNLAYAVTTTPVPTITG
jgi:hypothetical protein